MIKRMLHKVIIVWCLYGLIRLIIFAHPWLFWLAARVKPNFARSGEYSYDLHDYIPIPWDASSTKQSFWVWLTAIGGVAVALFLCAILAEAKDWLFNVDDHDSHLARLDDGQDDLLEDMKAIKKKFGIKDDEDE